MPKTHHLKTQPVYFDAVRRGDKTFEIRKNDRDFQTGDTLVLEEFKGGPPPAPRGPGQPPLTREELGYTGNTLEMRVSYCLHGPAYGLEVGHVVMGLDQERPWINWLGGPAPVPADARVDYKTRARTEVGAATAGVLRWEHLKINSDIVAYRVSKA